MKKISDYKNNLLEKQKNLKTNTSEILDLPKEIVLNAPLITILGSEKLSIENFKSIVEYSSEKIRLNTSHGVLKIEGSSLYIKEMNTEKILILGKLHKLEFIL